MKYHNGDYYDYIDRYNKSKLITNPVIPYDNITNIIISGPAGSGKYTSVLYYLSKFSPSKLKYDKKIIVTISKDIIYYIRISDIHYEIDIEQLGCNAKQYWHEIYIHIIHIIQQYHTQQVILCKNFHKINNDLLKVFYSYIQDSKIHNVKFILITNHLSFIPNNILNSFNIIQSQKLNNNQCIKKIGKNVNMIDTIENLNTYKSGFPQHSYSDKLTNNLYNYMETYPNINYNTLREHLYSILIYDVDISEVIWKILYKYIKLGIKIDDNFIQYINTFFQLYNNNYRPIYHLEKIIYYILNYKHECKECV